MNGLSRCESCGNSAGINLLSFRDGVEPFVVCQVCAQAGIDRGCEVIDLAGASRD